MKPVNRRRFLAFLGSMALAAAMPPFMRRLAADEPEKEFPYHMSDQEWKEKLSPQAYDVLREHGTERAFTSPLNGEHRKGMFVCAGCGQALYASDQKFDSGTGWPSFRAPVTPDAVGTSTDYKIGVPRTEVHCARCGGHLGHVFKDGPPPTGLRYCMNGVALRFEPGSRTS